MKDIDKNYITELLAAFSKLYPDPRCELNYETPFQLLIATVLAAQATDKKVNEVTSSLFKKLKSPKAFLSLTEEELGQEIKSINFYRTKARNILLICKTIMEEHNGEIPASREALTKMSGVGRKTANVVLSNAFNIPAIAVDTHVHRVANRLGLVYTSNVKDTELKLEELFPKTQWSKAHNYLVLHGRYVCNAKRPKCGICQLNNMCSFYNR